MGYSEEYVENMTRVHRQLRARPTTLVRLVKGIDHLCEKYPNSGEYHCLSEEIFNQDAYIAEKLGMTFLHAIRGLPVKRRNTPSDKDRFVSCRRMRTRQERHTMTADTCQTGTGASHRAHLSSRASCIAREYRVSAVYKYSPRYRVNLQPTTPVLIAEAQVLEFGEPVSFGDRSKRVVVRVERT